MTCIAGLVHEGKVYIGADSAGADDGWNMGARVDPKAFRRGEMLLGFTSSFRMGQLLQFKLTLPEHPAKMPVYEYMVARFIDAVRECLKAGGYQRTEDGREEAGNFLVGYRGSLFQIEADYQVGESADRLDAVGCGADYAKAVLYASRKSRATPRKRILEALQAAEHFSAFVCPPYRVLSV